MNVTLKMIAKEAGVSIMAVSTVLNHKGNSGVSEATRKRIQEIARRLDYHPNHLASATRTGIIRTIAVIASWKNSKVSDELYGIQKVATSLGYGVRLYGADCLEKTFSEIKSQRITHVIFVGISEEEQKIVAEYCSRLSLNLVFANSPGAYGYSGVMLNNFQAMYDITGHLIEQGHRKIGLLCSPHHLYINRERHRGYIQAMQDAGLAVCPEWLSCREYPDQAGMIAMLELRGAKKITAVAGISSQWMFNLIRYAVKKGIRIPEDVAIAGMSSSYNDAGNSVVDFSYSTYMPEEIGESAVRLLLDAEKSGIVLDGSTCFIRPRFVPMESTAFRRIS